MNIRPAFHENLCHRRDSSLWVRTNKQKVVNKPKLVRCETWEDSGSLVCVDCCVTFRLSEFVVNTQLFGIPEGGERLALRCDVEPVDPYQLHRGTPCGRVGVCSIEVVLKHRQCEDVRHLEEKTKSMHHP